MDGFVLYQRFSTGLIEDDSVLYPNPMSPTTADPVAAAADHRRGPRRRGPALEAAVYDAVLAELTACGFGGLAYERVAARAGTGKSALYRRWPRKADMVVDAVAHAMPALPTAAPTTGALREDLLAAVRRMADNLAGPLGAVTLSVYAEAQRHPELLAEMRRRILEPRRRQMLAMLAEGVARGAVRPEAVQPEVVEVAPTLVLHRFLESGGRVPDDVLAGIVDHVLVPLLEPRA